MDWKSSPTAKMVARDSALWNARTKCARSGEMSWNSSTSTWVKGDAHAPVATARALLPIMSSKSVSPSLSLPRFGGRVRDRAYAASDNCFSYSAGLT